MFVLTLTYYKGWIVTVINIIKHQIRHFIALLANINRTGGSRSTCTGARTVKLWCPLVSDLVNYIPQHAHQICLIDHEVCKYVCCLCLGMISWGIRQHKMCFSHWSDGYTSSYFKQTWKDGSWPKICCSVCGHGCRNGQLSSRYDHFCAIMVFNGQ